MNISTGQDDNVGPAAILAILESKSWYEQRFLKQVSSLYPNADNPKFQKKMIPLMYLQDLLQKVPAASQADTCSLAAKLIVDGAKECPYPSEVRTYVADAALQVAGLTFDKLYERAKEFFAFPPTQQATADRWIEQIIYTTVKRITRERFALISAQDWQQAVAEVMLAPAVQLASYQVPQEVVQTPTKHDFKSLLKKTV